MRTQKLVTIQDGYITSIQDGTFESGYSKTEGSKICAINDLLKPGGIDFEARVKELEKAIIGCSRLNEANRNYFIEYFGKKRFENIEEYYRNTKIEVNADEEKKQKDVVVNMNISWDDRVIQAMAASFAEKMFEKFKVGFNGLE